MEIIILGFALFIVGVGATIIYDRYKDKIQGELQRRRELHRSRTEDSERLRKELEAELLRRAKEIEEKNKKATQKIKKIDEQKIARRVKPASFNFGPISENSLPEEVLYETITVKELKKLFENDTNSSQFVDDVSSSLGDIFDGGSDFDGGDFGDSSFD